MRARLKELIAQMKLPQDTFILDATQKVLRWLGCVSYERVFEKITGRKMVNFGPRDIYVLIFFTLSVLIFVAASWHIIPLFIEVMIGVLSAVRMFEYVIFLLNVSLFPEAQKGSAHFRSHRRSVILLMFNYVETIFWFATWYSILAWHSVLTVEASSRSSAILRESIVSMVGNSTGAFAHLKPFGLFVVAMNDAVGLLMTIFLVTRFLSLLPRTRSSDPEEQD